jgi:Double-GTPase 2
MTEADEVLLEDDEQEEELQDHELEDEAPPPATTQPIVTADDAMTLEEARALSGRRGARLVLLMGEAETGKTAVIAMLWQRFLEEDGLAGHRLAGSRTARAFERRAHWARLEAREPEAHLPGTRVVDGGLLHLRVRRPDGRRVELLLWDLAGEQFEHVREGRRLVDELPWAARVDRFVVVLDAKALSLPGGSEIAVTRAQRLLLALQASTVVRDTARVAVLVTKGDLLTDAGEQALARHEPALLEVAHESDSDAACIRTGPRDAADPHGLGDLITWLCRDDRPQSPLPVREVQPQRSIAAFRA